MNRVRPTIAALLTLFYAVTGLAAESAVVTSMHYPAWLVRDYQTEPLIPGTLLQANDLIRTGEGSRVEIELSDVGIIKLGESVRLIVDEVGEQASATDDRIPTFQLLRGSFSYTTTTAPADAKPRIGIKIGAVAAEFQGAEVWAASIAQRDLFGLIDGELTVRGHNQDPLVLNQAPSLYIRSKDKPAPEVKRVDADQLARWSGVTRLDASRGIVDRNGEWQLVLISLTRRPQADQLLAQMRAQGFAVERKTVVRQGRTLHRLLLPGFISIDAALAARDRIEATFDISDAWVWKQSD